MACLNFQGRYLITIPSGFDKRDIRCNMCGVAQPTEEALYLYDVATLYALLSDRALRSNVSVRNGTWLFQQALGLNFTGTLLWDMALSTGSRTELHRYTALEPGSFNRLFNFAGIRYF